MLLQRKLSPLFSPTYKRKRFCSTFPPSLANDNTVIYRYFVTCSVEVKHRLFNLLLACVSMILACGDFTESDLYESLLNFAFAYFVIGTSCLTQNTRPDIHKISVDGKY